MYDILIEEGQLDVISKDAVPLQPTESVALILNWKLPVWPRTPTKYPVLAMDNPEGRLPDAKLHVNGGMPFEPVRDLT
jgi:hypothetical protein